MSDEDKKPDPPEILHTGDDPRRPPHWRYARARRLLALPGDKQVLVDRADDPMVRVFFVFCHELNRAKTPVERLALQRRYPGILEAIRLRKYATFETLGLFEGFLTTSANLAWLSDRFSLDPATVAWYESLFFDVWGRREANFWIETEVIKPQLYPGHKFSPDGSLTAALIPMENKQSWERACAYRRFGYHGGVVALELFATGFLTTDAKPGYKDLADTFIKKALETAVSNEGTAMVQSKRKLNKTEGEFIRLALELAERSLLSGSLDVVQGVQKALAMVSPLVGDDVKAELAKFAEQDENKAALLIGAAEMRHSQQARLHLGLDLSPETRELVDSFNAAREAADTP